ncbi:hypothetical protein KQH49_03565 [Mycetohabitans sp. B5]|uniref:Uncharacterized protein n=1 Tax=Mycetohabitans endofungorum TaxID=417203 RepID=A0A2P5K6N4_9BURK|nr:MULTISPECIES: hypothetical protein [Mycetohabitans]MCG1054090.1 hypothetical protein [Mycetohabitans sp. B5]PPB80993.1 hypothetical protein B0O95_1265 [Mycetohabitans endofungorum]
MSTADWREEKSEFVVQAICRVLSFPDLPQEARHDLEGEALWNALKLHADALQEQMGGTRWSPELVARFRKQPEKCNDWLASMHEPNFAITGYFDKD